MTCRRHSLFLLAVAWITDAQRRNVLLYPEFLAADYTHQTNAEAQPSFRLAGYDSMNRTFSGLESFLPNTCRWIFDWLARTVIPQLRDRRAISRMRVIGTDGEEKEYNPFVSLMGTDKTYKNLRHQLCCFHMFRMGPKGKGFCQGMDDQKFHKSLSCHAVNGPV